jgi:hypothetical protein
VTDDRDSQRTETMAQRDARLMRIQNDVPDYAIKKAVGAALRHAREAEEWSRTEFVALQQAHIHVDTLTLRIDLRALEILPAAVQEMATFIGCSPSRSRRLSRQVHPR